MEFSLLKNICVVLIAIGIISAGLFFIANNGGLLSFNQVASVLDATLTPPPLPETIINTTPPLLRKLENPPEIVKAIYVTGYSASSKQYLSYLTDLFRKTEINSVVVDIKGSDGRIGQYNRDNLISFLHGQNIYVIGRVAVFEDPVFAKQRPDLAIYNKQKTLGRSPTGEAKDIKKPVLWKDSNGQEWLDPASKETWDYNIGLAKEGFSHGFDEINFDYVRYPSDGKTSAMGFPISDAKVTSQSVIKEFFQYVRAQLTGEKISVDLFGQTTTNKDDMGIGQLLEDAFESFDYISPMIYPSHYINGFIGFKNPASRPYEVVKYSMDGAKARQDAFLQELVGGEATGTPAEESKSLDVLTISLAKFRPWLQDFSMGAVYDATMVSNEIMATKDALGTDYNGFMLWNPNNIYTKGAILK
jgi:hypothetical protein